MGAAINSCHELLCALAGGVEKKSDICGRAPRISGYMNPLNRDSLPPSLYVRNAYVGMYDVVELKRWHDRSKAVA